LQRAIPGRRSDARLLDNALLAIAAFCIGQTVPVPVVAVRILSPHAETVRQALTLTASTSSWMPLSIDESSTMWAGAVAIGTFALFFAARIVVVEGGLRQTVRGISAIGLGLSALAIAQAATAGRSIYWRFPTEYEGPLPFGPFVNRNHFATWIIMAVPLCVGYIMTRAGAPQTPPSQLVNARARLTRMADGRMAWLIVAAVVMMAALLISMSRSGILSLGAAAVISSLASRGRTLGNRKWWAIGIALATAVVALARVDMPGLAGRFAQSGSDIENRLRIWRDTLPMVADFWLTGTGVGSYRTAMLVYQRADRVVQFNQAHNHYLQAAAEGGVVLAGLAIAAIGGLRPPPRRALVGPGGGG
jgi:hypothetical protein